MGPSLGAPWGDVGPSGAIVGLSRPSAAIGGPLGPSGAICHLGPSADPKGPWQPQELEMLSLLRGV